MSYEEEDTCMSHEEEAADLEVFACHMRRRIHACHMRRRRLTLKYLPASESIPHHTIENTF
jgi:hypothetical protein